MNEPKWVSAPVGIDAAQWITRGNERTVVVAVHTMVSAQRLFDVVGLVESDPRIQVVYTRAYDEFDGGVADFLHAAGALEIPWAQAVRERFDLGLAASYGEISRLHAPMLVLPHGAGYGKQTPAATEGPSATRSVYGLGAEHLVRAGRLIASSVVLSHEAQREILVRDCPAAEGIAVVAGDPCYDRLLASLHRRDAYREAFGLTTDQRLVLVTSTWGAHSLYARDPGLPHRLLRELDPRRYRVAALIHPAAWFGHGRRQLRAWLTDELAAGLLLPDPEDDWRTLVVAADQVIGDHGSTTVYAAAVGKPVLRIDVPADEVAPGSAQAHLVAHAQQYDATTSCEPQLSQARHDGEIAVRLTSRPGAAHQLLRAEMYRLLRLPEPDRQARAEPIPVPVRAVAA